MKKGKQLIIILFLILIGSSITAQSYKELLKKELADFSKIEIIKSKEEKINAFYLLLKKYNKTETCEGLFKTINNFKKNNYYPIYDSITKEIKFDTIAQFIHFVDVDNNNETDIVFAPPHNWDYGITGTWIFLKYDTLYKFIYIPGMITSYVLQENKIKECNMFEYSCCMSPFNVFMKVELDLIKDTIAIINSTQIDWSVFDSVNKSTNLLNIDAIINKKCYSKIPAPNDEFNGIKMKKNEKIKILYKASNNKYIIRCKQEGVFTNRRAKENFFVGWINSKYVTKIE